MGFGYLNVIASLEELWRYSGESQRLVVASKTLEGGLTSSSVARKSNPIVLFLNWYEVGGCLICCRCLELQ